MSKFKLIKSAYDIIESPPDRDSDFRPHPPITTKAGKVVYKRKRHVFQMTDVRRVFLAATRPHSFSLGGIIGSMVSWNVFMIRWLLTVYPKNEFWVGRWLYDYFQGILGGLRELLREAGTEVDAILFGSGGAPPDQEGDTPP